MGETYRLKFGCARNIKEGESHKTFTVFVANEALN
jgi:hypothetical protein